jgi:hypothetical protein
MTTTRRPPVLTGFGIRGTKDVSVEMRGRETIFMWPTTIAPGGHEDFRLLRGDGNAHVQRISVSAPLD